jgi:SAM-dependent methyltransferase
MMRCNVCDSPLGEPIFTSHGEVALTSLCEQRPGQVKVWSFAGCAHLQGLPLAETQAYYATAYRISLDHDEEDQIYEVRNGRIVYRTEHQAEVLRRVAGIPHGAMLLDYGCAKASTPRRLLESRPDVQVHLFDVSDMYRQQWDAFVPPERQAVDVTPSSWAGCFDVVTSFFALEHIPRPIETVEKIAALLKEEGLLFAVVPDTFGNVADFVVIDHVNHFTEPSLITLLRRADFGDIRIDSTAHRGAAVVTARKRATDPSVTPSIEHGVRNVREHAAGLAAYWTELDDRVRNAERCHAGAHCAIYGSGFYGAYIFTALKQPQRVRCFLDQSPFQQGKTLFGKPIVEPASLPTDVQVLFVGLNPQIARGVIKGVKALASRSLNLVYLDADAEATP